MKSRKFFGLCLFLTSIFFCGKGVAGRFSQITKVMDDVREQINLMIEKRRGQIQGNIANEQIEQAENKTNCEEEIKKGLLKVGRFFDLVKATNKEKRKSLLNNFSRFLKQNFIMSDDEDCDKSEDYDKSKDLGIDCKGDAGGVFLDDVFGMQKGSFSALENDIISKMTTYKKEREQREREQKEREQKEREQKAREQQKERERKRKMKKNIKKNLKNIKKNLGKKRSLISDKDDFRYYIRAIFLRPVLGTSELKQYFNLTDRIVKKFSKHTSLFFLKFFPIFTKQNVEEFFSEIKMNNKRAADKAKLSIMEYLDKCLPMDKVVNEKTSDDDFINIVGLSRDNIKKIVDIALSSPLFPKKNLLANSYEKNATAFCQMLNFRLKDVRTPERKARYSMQSFLSHYSNINSLTNSIAEGFASCIHKNRNSILEKCDSEENKIIPLFVEMMSKIQEGKSRVSRAYEQAYEQAYKKVMNVECLPKDEDEKRSTEVKQEPFSDEENSDNEIDSDNELFSI